MAHNTNVVFVRGLSAEERRMLSAKAANTARRTVNDYMLMLIREDLRLPARPTTQRPGESRGAASRRRARTLGGAPGAWPVRDPRSPRGWTRQIDEESEIPGQSPAGPAACRPHRDRARCLAAGHWAGEPRAVEAAEARGTV